MTLFWSEKEEIVICQIRSKIMQDLTDLTNILLKYKMFKYIL